MWPFARAIVKAAPEVALVDEVEDVSDPSMDLELENPLENIADDVIELEGRLISRKTAGFAQERAQQEGDGVSIPPYPN